MGGVIGNVFVHYVNENRFYFKTSNFYVYRHVHTKLDGQGDEDN